MQERQLEFWFYSTQGTLCYACETQSPKQSLGSHSFYYSILFSCTVSLAFTLIPLLTFEFPFNQLKWYTYAMHVKLISILWIATLSICQTFFLSVFIKKILSLLNLNWLNSRNYLLCMWNSESQAIIGKPLFLLFKPFLLPCVFFYFLSVISKFFLFHFQNWID